MEEEDDEHARGRALNDEWRGGEAPFYAREGGALHAWRACRTWEGGTGGGSAPSARGVGAVTASPRSGRPARGTGGRARARTRADPLRPDAGVAFCVLPRRGADHGLRPSGQPDIGPAGAVVR